MPTGEINNLYPFPSAETTAFDPESNWEYVNSLTTEAMPPYKNVDQPNETPVETLRRPDEVEQYGSTVAGNVILLRERYLDNYAA